MLPVTLLTGLDEGFRGAVAGNLLASAGPAGVLVEYDVSTLSAGSVVRTARTAAGVIDHEVITMEHPCVSCALRGSLVQLLASIAAVERYDVALVNVPAAGDTHAIATEIDQHMDLCVGSVITTVEAATVTDDLTGEDLLRERGVPTAVEDGRATAEVVVRQLEYADAAILTTTTDDVGGLLRAINPGLLVKGAPTGLLDARQFGLDASTGVRSRGVEPGSIAAAVDGLTFVWQSNRPFHPERLYDALEDLVAGSARGRGTLWIATQHRRRLSWDSFGTNIAIGTLGPWLADLPADRWPTVGQQHQARSALEWHPEYGDRASYLSLTGVGLDARELRERLDGCVLRADEAVHPLTDPFAPYLEGSTAA